jgi:hypothetical protein
MSVVWTHLHSSWTHGPWTWSDAAKRICAVNDIYKHNNFFRSLASHWCLYIS